jgi:hypothetical protein
MGNTFSIRDLGHSQLTLRDDGIIILRSVDEHSYTIEDVKQNWNAIKELSPGRKAYILNIAGNYTGVEPGVREFVSKGEHAEFIAAECFVIRSLAQRLLVNFYLAINKPVVATAFFTDEAKAEKWLKKLMFANKGE